MSKLAGYFGLVINMAFVILATLLIAAFFANAYWTANSVKVIFASEERAPRSPPYSEEQITEFVDSVRFWASHPDSEGGKVPTPEEIEREIPTRKEAIREMTKLDAEYNSAAAKAQREQDRETARQQREHNERAKLVSLLLAVLSGGIVAILGTVMAWRHRYAIPNGLKWFHQKI